MKESIKKLRVPNLQIVVTTISGNRYIQLILSDGRIVKRYNSYPVQRVTDFIKLFELHLSKLDWNQVNESNLCEYKKLLDTIDRSVSVQNNRYVVCL